MNIRKLNEDYEAILGADPERLATENAAYEKRQKKQPFLKAIDGLEELKYALGDSVDPATGKMDRCTDALYSKVVDMIHELDSVLLGME